MSAAHTTSSAVAEATHLDKGRAGRVFTLGAVLAVVGLVLAVLAALSDSHRFAFSYLTGFYYVLTLGLGGLFFVLLQHVTKAGWSVGPRRVAEWLAGVLPLCALLFIPLALWSSHIWHEWWSPNPSEEGYELIHAKQGYLNPTFFYIRVVLYFVIWSGLTLLFRRNSLAQDSSGDPALTSQLQKWAPPGMFLFALSLTFAAFDWIMSLNPHWYSTIFGVYVFSGCVVSSLAFIALVTIWLQRTGLLGQVSTVEHQHDLGKLLFGFIVFWAYIGFSQFFLIWYANIPEETIFYKVRWAGSWQPLSYLLILGHFWFPFFLLLSRHAKRNKLVLGFGAVWMLVMHYADVYWLVMPNLDREGMHFSWLDLGGLLLPVGVLALWMGLRLRKDPLYPLRDPRLPEAVQLVNL